MTLSNYNGFHQLQKKPIFWLRQQAVVPLRRILVQFVFVIHVCIFICTSIWLCICLCICICIVFVSVGQDLWTNQWILVHAWLPTWLPSKAREGERSRKHLSPTVAKVQNQGDEEPDFPKHPIQDVMRSSCYELVLSSISTIFDALEENLGRNRLGVLMQTMWSGLFQVFSLPPVRSLWIADFHRGALGNIGHYRMNIFSSLYIFQSFEKMMSNDTKHLFLIMPGCNK